MRCSDTIRRNTIRKTTIRTPVLLGTLAVVATLTGCSDLYYDRRETVAFGAADAVATDKAIHIIDPWPAAAANRNIPGQGTTMAIAAERYRTGKVLKPKGIGTSTSYTGAPDPAASAPTVAGATSGGAAAPNP